MAVPSGTMFTQFGDVDIHFFDCVPSIRCARSIRFHKQGSMKFIH